MSEVIRYLASYTPYEGLDLNGQCARHDGDYFVSAADFDRVTAERDAARMSMTEPPIYTSWRNLERGQHLAVTGVFDDIHMTNAEAILSLQLENSRLRQRLTAADERADVLEVIVGEVLDAVGREPLDLDAVLRLRARMRASLKPAQPAKDEHICTGCGNKGWTANCKECVPY